MWIEEFKQNAIYRLRESNRMNEISLENITEEELWKRPNENSNSIGNLLLHLCGNIRQYAISSLGEQPDTRARDEEFAAQNGQSKHELMKRLIDTVDQAISIIQDASEKQLLRKRKVQGFEFSGIGVVIHVVEHYSYHTGQIAFWVKLLKDRSLGFYDSMDLNTKNED